MHAALQLKVMISVCEMTYTRTAIVAMQQTESDKIVGRSHASGHVTDMCC